MVGLHKQVEMMVSALNFSSFTRDLEVVSEFLHCMRRIETCFQSFNCEKIKVLKTDNFGL